MNRPPVKNGTWKTNEAANEAEIRAFGDTMYELNDALRITSSSTEHREFRARARRASVSIRKLLSDGLINKVLYKPRFHKIKKPSDTDPFILGWNGKVSYVTQRGEQPLWTMEIDSKIEIHSLPGWIHQQVSLYEIDSDIFNNEIEPELPLNKWLKEPLLKVATKKYERSFSLGEILKYVANTEGAHTDNYEHRGNKLSKAQAAQFMEAIGRADAFTYPHWVVMFVAIYLRNRQAQGLAEQAENWKPYIEKDAVSALDGYAHIKGRTENLDWRGGFIPMEVDLNNPEKAPPTEYQQDYWIITSAVD